jgi:non-canonical poly(A) RNA polymerase PAPD5/7
MLCLRDPADETNDLGRKGACIKHVQKTFKHIAWKLDAQLRTGKTAFAHSFLQTMVGDTYMLNFARRQRLEQEGRALLASMKSSFAYTAQAIRDEEKVKAQDGQNAAEQAMKLRQISERQAAMTDVDAYGGVVTSILGMPSVDEFKDGNADLSEDGAPPEEVDRSEDVDSSMPPSIHYDVSKTYGSNFHYRVSRKQTPGGTGSLP